ncbi:hypothetical protein GCK72_006416 [Caenorhabditis remanei]|uniref:Uncharacterized protein n=1 Tax=Caenorhabditis remanei TaxID=31234 RepID=A0A6A5HGQ1_CAERE|nr:hypothetical protein GCK72_006416 [Caenorhabditis remanei]KAF1766459.1 hypothetical protein GCK72_006416 [Caenorhabditis remanei]
MELGFTAPRSNAALIATDASSGAVTDASDERNDPIGVRAAPTMKASLLERAAEVVNPRRRACPADESILKKCKRLIF